MWRESRLQVIAGPESSRSFLAVLVKDLKAHAGRSAVVPGLYQDASVTMLALAINNALGNVGKTVLVGAEPVNPLPGDQIAELKGLVADLNAGKVNWLVILNANPIYNAPADLNFAAAFQKAKTVVHLSSNLDETGQICALAYPRGACAGVVVGCAGV